MQPVTDALNTIIANIHSGGDRVPRPEPIWIRQARRSQRRLDGSGLVEQAIDANMAQMQIDTDPVPGVQPISRGYSQTMSLQDLRQFTRSVPYGLQLPHDWWSDDDYSDRAFKRFEVVPTPLVEPSASEQQRADVWLRDRIAQTMPQLDVKIAQKCIQYLPPAWLLREMERWWSENTFTIAHWAAVLLVLAERIPALKKLKSLQDGAHYAVHKRQQAQRLKHGQSKLNKDTKGQRRVVEVVDRQINRSKDDGWVTLAYIGIFALAMHLRLLFDVIKFQLNLSKTTAYQKLLWYAFGVRKLEDMAVMSLEGGKVYLNARSAPEDGVELARIPIAPYDTGDHEVNWALEMVWANLFAPFLVNTILYFSSAPNEPVEWTARLAEAARSLPEYPIGSAARDIAILAVGSFVLPEHDELPEEKEGQAKEDGGDTTDPQANGDIRGLLRTLDMQLRRLDDDMSPLPIPIVIPPSDPLAATGQNTKATLAQIQKDVGDIDFILAAGREAANLVMRRARHTQ